VEPLHAVATVVVALAEKRSDPAGRCARFDRLDDDQIESIIERGLWCDVSGTGPAKLHGLQFATNTVAARRVF
jgi:hypothetical protein